LLKNCKDMICFRRLHHSPLGNSSSQDVEGAQWPSLNNMTMAMSRYLCRTVPLLESWEFSTVQRLTNHFDQNISRHPSHAPLTQTGSVRISK
ncbi:hypothetical protein KCU85_g501, partial [Aureobasidium melanogenum]